MPWRKLFTLLRLLVSAGLLTYLIWRADPMSVWASWQTIDLRLFSLALILQFAGIALSAAKWGVLLTARQQRQPYSWLLGTYLVGQFASNFLPTSVGGDAVRAAALGRRIGSLSEASASIFIERLTGFLVLSLIANIALLLAYMDTGGLQIASAPQVYLLSAAVALASIGALTFSFSGPRFQRYFGRWLPGTTNRMLERLIQAVADYVPRGRNLVLILAMCLVYQSLLIVTHVICGLALGIKVPLLVYALMVPITDIIGLAPIFVNNLGARDLVFSLYLGQAGVAPASAIALASTIFTLRLLTSVLGGFVSLFGAMRARTESTSIEESISSSSSRSSSAM